MDREKNLITCHDQASETETSFCVWCSQVLAECNHSTITREEY